MKVDIEFEYVSFQKCSYDSTDTKIAKIDIIFIILMLMVFKVFKLDHRKRRYGAVITSMYKYMGTS